MSEPARILKISNFQVLARGGLYEAERLVKRPFRFDVTMRLRASKDPGNLSETVDYEQVCEIIRMEMGQSFQLIEEAAQRVFDKLLNQPNCLDMSMTLTKLHVPIKGLGQTSITLTTDIK